MGYFTDTDFDSTLDMIDAITEVLDRKIRKMDTATPNDIGLDMRCGRVYIDLAEEVIAVNGSRSIDYYGGFEYIKEGEGRITMGDYTFFTTESSRVQECFDRLAEKEFESEDE
jgi:hypothetical protein